MKNIILQGDAWQLAKTLPDESINCIVTSPPYFGLRSYLPNEHEDKKTEFGCESTPEEYVDKLVALFRELRRALRHDGTVWLNLGDSYNGSGGAGGDYAPGGLKDGQPKYPGRNVSGLKPKDLCGIPWMCAFALRADGWYLRSEIIWHKRAPMPESVTDRPTKAHEQVFLLTKSPRYHYDADAIAEPIQASTQERYQYGWNGRDDDGSNGARTGSAYKKMKAGATMGEAMGQSETRNKRSVWTLGPESYKGAHFAVMPTKLVEPCILAGCPHKVCAECGAPWVRQVEREYVNGRKSGPGNRAALGDVSATSIFRTNLQPTSTTTGFAPTCECHGHFEEIKVQRSYTARATGTHDTEKRYIPNDGEPATRPGVVLDPFLGSGTVAVVARRLGRDWLGFELNPEYVELAYKRIDGTQPPLFVEGL